MAMSNGNPIQAAGTYLFDKFSTSGLIKVAEGLQIKAENYTLHHTDNSYIQNVPQRDRDRYEKQVNIIATGKMIKGGAEYLVQCQNIATAPLVAEGLLGNMGSQAVKGGMSAYETALAGGKHTGWLQNMIERTTPQLQKGITSMERNILEHQNLISDPAKYLEQYGKGNWNLLDPRQQQYLLNVKWPGDIQRAKEQINILQGILKTR
jgi:hypothetical protein